MPGWLRVLASIPLGLCMLVVYLSLFNQANLIFTEGLQHLPAFALLVLMYIVLAWVKGKVTKGFARVLLITVLIVAGWALVFVVMPVVWSGVTWLMDGLSRMLKKAWPIYKKGVLANTYSLTALVHCVIAVEAVVLIFAIRNRFMKPGIAPVLMVVTPLVLYWLMFYCAVCDVHKDLRKVKIAEFINLWMHRALNVEIATVIAVTLGVLLCGVIQLLRYKKRSYTDGDLMAIRKFARVRVVGYYLLKAKLQGVLVHSWEKAEPMDVHGLRVADLSPEQKEAYCKENPEIAQILEYLENHAGEEPVGIVDVLRDVQLKPGDRTKDGIRVEKWYTRIKTFAAVAAVLCGLLIWMSGFSKYLISTFLGKSADDIMLHLVLFAPVALSVLGVLLNGWSRLIWKLGFRKSLLRFQAAQIENSDAILRNVDQCETQFTDEEISKILRAYALRPYGAHAYDGWNHQEAYTFALLGATEDMAWVAEQ